MRTRLRPDEVLSRIDAEGLEYVRCQFIDLSGVARGRAVHRDYIGTVLEKGLPFAQVNNLVDIDDQESDLAFGSQAGDFWAVPDPETLVRLPYVKSSGLMFTSLVGIDGSPWPTCGRAVLERLAGVARHELGTVRLGFEQEGYVLRKVEGAYEPVVRGKQMTLEILDLLDGFVNELTAALKAMRVALEKLTAEGGWGMFEVNFAQAEPLEAAEQYFRFKQAFRGVARLHGLVGSFMPKPFADGYGAGLHVHISCTDEEGLDILSGSASSNASSQPLSQPGRAFLAGLLAHAPAIIALGSPSVNSFKRLQPGTWAPTHASYGIGNRSAMIRVVRGREDPAVRQQLQRLELRSPDGTCNPYLLAAGILAAGLDGVRRGLDPGPPTQVDVSRMTPEERIRLGLRQFPSTLEAAADALEADEPMRDLLGTQMVDAYVKVKRLEWAKFMRHVTPWEHRYYAEFY